MANNTKRTEIGMIKKFTDLSACLLCAISLLTMGAQAQKAPAPTNPALKGCETLQSKDAIERMNAAEKLVVEHTELKNCLLRQLQVEVVNPSREFNGSFSQLLWVLEKLRVSAAVGDLVPLIELRLTGTPGQGGFGGSGAYFPVATALAEIGGPNLADSLFNRLAAPTNDDVLRVSTWTLLKAYSKPVTRSMIQVRLDEVSKVLKNIGVSDTNPEKKNLERMLQLLDSKQQLLPTESPTPNKTTAPQTTLPSVFGGAVGEKK
jgi:hypothetical protein